MRLEECAFFGLLDRYEDSMLLLKSTFPAVLQKFDSYGKAHDMNTLRSSLRTVLHHVPITSGAGAEVDRSTCFKRNETNTYAL